MPGLVLFREEGPAEDGQCPKQLKQVRGNVLHLHMPRLINASRGVDVVLIDGNGVERMVPSPHIGKVGIREIASWDRRTPVARIKFSQCHQLIRSAER